MENNKYFPQGVLDFTDIGGGIVTLTGNKEYTPDPKIVWGPNEIMVFGSNTEGLHLGGAAHFAFKKLGAQWGLGEGFSGQTYAVPTLYGPNSFTSQTESARSDNRVKQEELTASLLKLTDYVKAHPEYVFYLTKIGLGIGGWALTDVQKAFWSTELAACDNLIYPIELEIPDDATL